MTHELHGLGTNVEGELSDIMNVVQRIHGVLHAGGAPRLATSIKIGTRVDKMGTPVGKERAITDFDSQ